MFRLLIGSAAIVILEIVNKLNLCFDDDYD